MTYINYTSPTIDRRTVFRGTAEQCRTWLKATGTRLNETDKKGGYHYANGPVAP